MLVWFLFIFMIFLGTCFSIVSSDEYGKYPSEFPNGYTYFPEQTQGNPSFDFNKKSTNPVGYMDFNNQPTDPGGYTALIFLPSSTLNTQTAPFNPFVWGFLDFATLEYGFIISEMPYSIFNCTNIVVPDHFLLYIDSIPASNDISSCKNYVGHTSFNSAAAVAANVVAELNLLASGLCDPSYLDAQLFCILFAFQGVCLNNYISRTKRIILLPCIDYSYQYYIQFCVIFRSVGTFLFIIHRDTDLYFNTCTTADSIVIMSIIYSGYMFDKICLPYSYKSAFMKSDAKFNFNKLITLFLFYVLVIFIF